MERLPLLVGDVFDDEAVAPWQWSGALEGLVGCVDPHGRLFGLLDGGHDGQCTALPAELPGSAGEERSDHVGRVPVE